VGEEEKRENLRNRVFCSTCSRSETRRHGLVPLGWQEMPDPAGRTIAMCPECVRTNLWLIEGRLDIDSDSGE
jgi:hypothetical protein